MHCTHRLDPRTSHLGLNPRKTVNNHRKQLNWYTISLLVRHSVQQLYQVHSLEESLMEVREERAKTAAGRPDATLPLFV